VIGCRHTVLTALSAAFLIAEPALAHHSFAIFDQTQVLEHSGAVSEIEWISPHVWLHVDVADDAGNLRSWAFEAGNPGQLANMGWDPAAFAPGAQVTVGYRPMKDGSRGGQLMSVVLPDGSKVCSNRGCS